MDGGLFSNTLVNDGLIQVKGGAGQTNRITLDADVSGSGIILLDGGDSASNVNTWLTTSGDLTGGTVVLRNAYWDVVDVKG